LSFADALSGANHFDNLFFGLLFADDPVRLA
jgi:hypothetical protein